VETGKGNAQNVHFPQIAVEEECLKNRLPSRLYPALYLSPDSGWMVGGLYPGRGKRFFSSGFPDWFWGLPIFRE
jgi:hypothetical protein